MAPQIPPSQYPIYNTTFLLYQLNVNLQLDSEFLKQHARQFRDILTGEALRGVRVNVAAEEDALARAGALREVTWKILLEEEGWTAEDATIPEIEDATMILAASRGIVVTVAYEQAVYTALLLRDDRGDPDESVLSMGENLRDPQHFPLLLTKMTPPLRDTFIKYITETFDVRIFPLHLPKKLLIRTLDKYIADISIWEEDETMVPGQRSQVFSRIVKDVVIIIGFELPSNSLKNIEINITKEDMIHMVLRGEQMQRQGDADSPFFDALAKYVQVHMSLDLYHEQVKLLRIACGAFVIGGGQGKIKITQPVSEERWSNNQRRADRRLVHGLINAAANVVLTAHDHGT